MACKKTNDENKFMKEMLHKQENREVITDTEQIRIQNSIHRN